MNNKTDINNKTEFFQTNSPVNVYVSSQARWIKIYQYLIFLVIISSVFNIAYMINLDILFIGRYGLIGYGSLSAYILLLSSRMFSNLQLTSGKLSLSWIWMCFYIGIIIVCNVFIFYIGTKRITMTLDRVILLSIVQFVTTISLAISFRVWLHFSESKSNPIFQIGIKYKIILIIMETIVSILVITLYQKTNPSNWVTWITTRSVLSYVFLTAGFLIFTISYFITWGLFNEQNNKIKRIHFVNGTGQNYLWLGIVIGVSLWFTFFYAVPKSVFKVYDIIFVVVIIGIDIITILLLIFAKNELRSSLLRSTFIMIALACIWIGVYIVLEVYPYDSTSFIVIGLAGIASSILTIAWIISDIKINRAFSFFFSISIMFIAIGLVMYAIFDQLGVTAIVDTFSIDILISLIIVLPISITILINAIIWRNILANINKKNRYELRRKRGKNNV